MDDSINRQAAIDVLEERLKANGYSNTTLVSELNRCIGYLMRLPSADVQPVRHGWWIPVSEKLPDDGRTVLVTDWGETDFGKRFDGRWWNCDGDVLKDVSAWMPLPKPYKDGD